MAWENGSSPASSACEQFEDFAATHGGDRAGLISMISTLAGGVDAQFEINVRKTLFRGQSHVWGVHSRVAVRTTIFMPRLGPSEVGVGRIDDIAFVTGDVDMVRHRQNEPLVVNRWLDTKVDMEQRAAARAAPGDAPDPSPSSELELLAAFSSDPLPEMSNRRTSGGIVEMDLVFPPGRTGATTMFSCEFRPSLVSPPDEVSFASGTFITMPMQSTVRDILVPAGWSDPATARASVYARRHHPERVYEERTADLLPQTEALECLGARDGVPELPDIRNHAATVRHVLERHGWLGTVFDVYRCRVEYPLMHSLVIARVGQARNPPRR